MVEEIPKEILKQYLVSNTEDGSIAGDDGTDTVFIQGLANAVVLCCVVLRKMLYLSGVLLMLFCL